MLEFRDLEKKYSVFQIKMEGKQIWPILRIFYYFSLRSKLNSQSPISFQNKVFGKVKIFFKNISLLRGLLKKADVLIFSVSLEVRKVRNKYQNKLFIDLIESLEKRSLVYKYFENPSQGHVSRDLRHEKNVSTTLIFEMCAYLMAFFMNVPKVQSQELLDQINSDYKLGVSYKRILKVFFALKKIFRIYLRIIKPRLIIVSQYYSLPHMALMAVSKELGIKTAEYQHGIINPLHPAYINYDKNLNSSEVVPDCLLSFGDAVADMVGGEGIYAKDKIVSVGSSYLEYILSQKKEAKSLYQGNPSKKKVLVTLQSINQDVIVEFIQRAAVQLPEFHFYLLSRMQQVGAVTSGANVSYVNGDFYALVQDCDLHVTAFSTCAMEALFFKKTNILINNDGMAKLYYGDIFKGLSQEAVSYTRTVEEFIIECKKHLGSVPSIANTPGMNLDTIFKPQHSAQLEKLLTSWLA